MIIDLTGLSGASLPRELALSYENFPSKPQAYDGPFTGSLYLGAGPSQSISISGTLVTRVILDGVAPTVLLKVPSPVPGYQHVTQLEMTLRFVKAVGTWEIESPGEGWFKKRDMLKGQIDQWLAQLNDSPAILLKLKDAKGFPLDQIGIAKSFDWTWAIDEHHMYMGLFLAAPGCLDLLLVPSSVSESNIDTAAGLRLFGLDKTALGVNTGWTVCPVVLGLQISDSKQGLWRAIVQWKSFAPSLKIEHPNRLRTSPLLDILWNNPVRNAMAGWRLQRSAQPLVPLPLLTFEDKAGKLTEEIQPILVFDLPNPATTVEKAKARLRHVHMHHNQEIPIRAEFGWQVDGTSTQPSSLHMDTLVFSGFIEKSQQTPWSGVPKKNEPADWLRSFKNACKPLDESEQREWLSRWSAKGKVTRRSVQPDRWMIWGSLEFDFNPKSEAELLCILRGEWTERKCDIYPESVLTINTCRVRVSSAADAAGQDLDAAFGTLDEVEDDLQRNSEPLRFPMGPRQGSRSGRICKVRITHRTMLGRNAVTKVEVYDSHDRGPLGEESVIMQMRPFFVGVVQPADLDAESGSLIAVWTSNDPEGLQWRVPDSTVKLTFPPQAVGESMERGVRFWQPPGRPNALEPWLDPNAPVLYRFSPPTQIVLRPSVRDRRYNKAPSNLGAVLANAKVDSFTTEIVYPVEAKFQMSEQGLPDIRIAETSSMLGRPTENLEPLPAKTEENKDHPFERWLRVAFSSEAASYAYTVQSGLRESLEVLRASQAAAKANFAARLAQFHVYDPWSAQGRLALKEGIKFRIRDTKSGAPPLANPLAQWKFTPPSPVAVGSDLTAQQKAEIPQFLSETTGDWGTLAEGSIPAGVVHTMEFASELVAVLKRPVATQGQIESLAFSALGATSQMSASFDEGRTTFIVESSFGQLSRLIKIRIGRVGVVWNKAKHVIVYERTTVYSMQFEDEQKFGSAGDAKSTLGWPILRKTEEFVEPLETVRRFGAEEQKNDNYAAFLTGSEFVTPRIYVNGAWGSDLGHGYEIPLWNAEDQTGFYPKPELALQARATEEGMSRCWFAEPDQLVFYTNTEPGTGDNPDKWNAQTGVDCPIAIARMPLSMAESPQADVLRSRSMPSPRLGAMRRRRFDLAVRSDGKVDLQHARGETQMLVTLDVVSIARTTGISQTKADELPEKAKAILEEMQQVTQKASRLDAARSLQARANDILARVTDQLFRAGADCQKIKHQLTVEIKGSFTHAREAIKAGLDELPALSAAPEDALPFVAGVDRMRKQLLNYERSLRAPFDKVLADLEQLRKSVQEGGETVREEANKQIEAAGELVLAVVEMQHQQLKAFCNQALKSPVNGGVEEITSILRDLLAASIKLETAISTAAPNLKDAKNACEQALSALRKVKSHALLGSLAGQLEGGVLLIDHFLDDEETEVMQVWATLQAVIHGLSKKLYEVATEAVAAGGKIKSCITGLDSAMGTLVVDITGKINAASAAIATINPLDMALREAIARINDIHNAAKLATGQAADDLTAGWRKTVDDSMRELRLEAIKADAKLLAVAQGAIDLARQLAEILRNGANSATNWLTKLENEALEVIYAINCAEPERMVSMLREKLQRAEAEIRKRLTDQANEILDVQTRQKLAELEKVVIATTPQLANQAGKAIKLMKALGELPALPSLTFNAERAEYIFDDFKKEIETSPFAAKLGEIDSGLKQLGIAVPANKLLDQIIPMKLEGLGFNEVFKNFGAIDFKGLLEKFQLPPLSSDQIKITQGVDKVTRSAWVMANVNASFQEQQSLFEFAGLSVTLAQMKLWANSDTRSSKTDALFAADWSLQFGGASLAKFRDVTVRFDGSSFQFDIEPSKVELHPALKFVDEFAKRFKPNLPPAVEIEKDSRGIPVGARASMVTDIILPPFGIVEIGPLRIASGLAMRMADDGQFVVTANVSVGAKTAPVWVQIGYLGGGMWLEANATYRSSIQYSASVGLAIGCVKAISVANLAQGSLALLLYAYAEISNSGGSLRVGFSMTGSARILGMCNASIQLLLEAEHSHGNTEGRGTLDVKVDICWCYTLRVRRDVNHKIS